MGKEKSVAEVAQNVFVRLGLEGVECVILHHFNFEEGGDIDFCAKAPDLDLFLLHLKVVVEIEKWEIVQLLVHEQSGAYIVCRDSCGPGRYLLFDYCQDYRTRGHLILRCSELLENARVLPWGGSGSHGFIELAYRFSKAAAKKKNPRKVTSDLESLYGCYSGPFERWLKSRWSLELKRWDEPSVALILGQLGQLLAKQHWSLDEVALKLKRMMKPRGLWIECPEELVSAIASEVGPCFRGVHKGGQSLKGILGSTLVIEKTGKTPVWKRELLKWMNCWLEASSSEEILRFLVGRSARYQNWE